MPRYSRQVASWLKLRLGTGWDTQKVDVCGTATLFSCLYANPHTAGYLRLGIMARDSGQIHEASKWFKQALEVDSENADIVAYMGNLHMRNSEWGPAQKKFEKILEMVRVYGKAIGSFEQTYCIKMRTPTLKLLRLVSNTRLCASPWFPRVPPATCAAGAAGR